MIQEHPDEHLHRDQVKAIIRGSRQSADTAAMEAMWEAIEAGKTREESETIFSETYQKFLYGKETLLPVK